MTEIPRERFDPLLIEGDGPTNKRHEVQQVVFMALHQLALTRETALADIKSVRWKNWAVWILILTWIIAMAWTLGFVLTSYPSWISSSACHPDGNFDPFTKYSLWQSSGFFQITLPFGSLTFAQAKVVDVAWDVIVGRGGQALIAYVSWRVVAIYVASSMQVTPITYRPFRTFFLDREPSFMSSISLISDFTRRRRLNSRIATTFIMLVISFALLFPTLASAMTGYTPRIEAFIADYNKNWVLATNFRPVLYVIHDGPRVGLPADYPVLLSDRELDPDGISDWFSSSLADSVYTSFTDSNHTKSSYDMVSEEICNLQKNTSNYVSKYGFYGLNNSTETEWYGKKVPGPVLNISATYLPDDYGGRRGNRSPLPPLKSPFGADWANSSGRQPFKELSMAKMAYDNRTFDITFFEDKGSCQSQSDDVSKNYEYRWGFSFIQLFILLLLLNLWGIGLYIMWLKGHLTLKMRDSGNVPENYTAVLGLANVIRAELQELAEDADHLTNEEIETIVDKHLHGGQYLSAKLEDTRSFGFVRGIWCWMKKELIWGVVLVMLLITVLALSVAVPLENEESDTYNPTPRKLWEFCLFLTPGYLFTLAVGQTARSRFGLLLAAALLSAVITGSLEATNTRLSRD